MLPSSSYCEGCHGAFHFAFYAVQKTFQKTVNLAEDVAYTARRNPPEGTTDDTDAD